MMKGNTHLPAKAGLLSRGDFLCILSVFGGYYFVCIVSFACHDEAERRRVRCKKIKPNKKGG